MAASRSLRGCPFLFPAPPRWLYLFAATDWTVSTQLSPLLIVLGSRRRTVLAEMAHLAGENLHSLSGVFVHVTLAFSYAKTGWHGHNADIFSSSSEAHEKDQEGRVLQENWQPCKPSRSRELPIGPYQLGLFSNYGSWIRQRITFHISAVRSETSGIPDPFLSHWTFLLYRRWTDEASKLIEWRNRIRNFASISRLEAWHA